MCNPIHADIVVLIKSKFDGKWWEITNNHTVRRLSDDDVTKMLSNCFSTLTVTYCPHNKTLLVWSKRGNAGIGFRGVDPEDSDVWCNLARLADLLREKLPEPILTEDVYAAASELFWSSQAPELALT